MMPLRRNMRVSFIHLFLCLVWWSELFLSLQSCTFFFFLLLSVSNWALASRSMGIHLRCFLFYLTLCFFWLSFLYLTPCIVWSSLLPLLHLILFIGLLNLATFHQNHSAPLQQRFSVTPAFCLRLLSPLCHSLPIVHAAHPCAVSLGRAKHCVQMLPVSEEWRLSDA